MSLALSLCQYVLRPWRGLGPGLAWPRLASPRPRRASKRSIAGLHQHNRKGKIVMIKTRRYKRLVFGFVFLHLKLIWFLETELGPPLFEALIANSMLVCVTLMCFYIGTAQLKKVHGWA